MLAASAAEPSVRRRGYDLGRQVGRKSGSRYPILMRLSDRGLLEADPRQGRPARHLYRLTGAGARLAQEVTVNRPITRPAGHRSEPRGAW